MSTRNANAESKTNIHPWSEGSRRAPPRTKRPYGGAGRIAALLGAGGLVLFVGCSDGGGAPVGQQSQADEVDGGATTTTCTTTPGTCNYQMLPPTVLSAIDITSGLPGCNQACQQQFPFCSIVCNCNYIGNGTCSDGSLPASIVCPAVSRSSTWTHNDSTDCGGTSDNSMCSYWCSLGVPAPAPSPAMKCCTTTRTTPPTSEDTDASSESDSSDNGSGGEGECSDEGSTCGDPSECCNGDCNCGVCGGMCF